MIDLSPIRKLKTAEEKLIVLLLSISPPLRQYEILEILRLNKGHCVKTLSRLKSDGIIDTIEERRTILYKVRTAYPEVRTAYPEVRLASPIPAEDSPHSLSLSFVNLTKETNKQKDFYEDEKIPVESASAVQRPLTTPHCPAPSQATAVKTPHSPPVTRPKTKPTKVTPPVPNALDAVVEANGGESALAGFQWPVASIGTNPKLPNNFRCDGTIYGSDLDRSDYLDRMLLAFSDIDYKVTVDDLKRINIDPNLLDTSPHQYFVECLKKSGRELYKTPKGYAISTPVIKAVDNVSEELNHRIAYALAHGVAEFDHWQAFKAFFNAMPTEGDLKNRTNYVIFPIRDIFIRNGWGWEPNLLGTIKTFTNEKIRAERLKDSPRIEYFPVYSHLLKIQADEEKEASKKADEEMRRNRKGSGTASPQSPSPSRISFYDFLELKSNEFRSADLGELSFTFKREMSKFENDLDAAAEYIEMVKIKSIEMKNLANAPNSVFQQAAQGWEQDRVNSRIWYPKNSVESGE